MNNMVIMPKTHFLIIYKLSGIRGVGVKVCLIIIGVFVHCKVYVIGIFVHCKYF